MRHVWRAPLAMTAMGLALLPSCGSSESAAAKCEQQTSVDRFKELTIVDDAVVGDRRASNAADGPWSFRHAIEEMTPQGGDPVAFVRAWFDEWVTLGTLNGYPIPDAKQAEADATQSQFATNMKAFVWCPWMRATPANACNTNCSQCAASTIDMAKAPFRLLAIANRLDLRFEGGINPLGESRLVFGLTHGPADDPASAGLPMTIILEYALPSSRSLGDWAQSWHALGRHAAFDDSYRDDLQALTESFVRRDAMPERPNGSALSQARSNGTVLFWAWQMREFQIGTDGQIHAHTVRNAPDVKLNGSEQLTTWMAANAQDILANKYLVPETFLGATTDNLLFRWSFPRADSAVALAFAKGTCSGCHSEGGNRPVDTAFHISPLQSGIAKLSPFLNSPDDPLHDELARRSTVLKATLCGE